MPDDYWHGYDLRVGGGSQSLLTATLPNDQRPTTGGPYKWTTNQNWWISCLPTTANGAGGEGFLAISPDGTKYWFDWLSKRKVDDISAQNSTSIGSTYRTYYMFRAEYQMMVTRVEDRFGNWVRYNWLPGEYAKLDSITSKDGRAIKLDYNTQGLVSRVTESTSVNLGLPGDVTLGARFWQYTYTPVSASGITSYNLTQVTLPDGSTWAYNFAALTYRTATPPYCQDPLPPPQPDWACLGGGVNVNGPVTADVTHPSGAKVEFTFREHFQLGDMMTPNQNHSHSWPLGIVSKRISGAGLAPATWQYAFAPSQEQVATACQTGGCPTKVITDQIDPDGSISRRIFGVVANQDNAMLLGELQGRLEPALPAGGSQPITCSPRWGCDLLDDPTPGGSTVPVFYREIDMQYVANGQATPYVVRVGVNPLGGSPTGTMATAYSSERRLPMQKKIITQQGVNFAWQVETHSSCGNLPCFDVYGNPTRVSRFSAGNAGGDSSRTEVSTYAHDTGKWVIGQPLSLTDVATTRIVSRTEYNANLLPEKTYSFNVLQQTITYNADGTVATVKDGRDNLTALSTWKRGIPQLITYPTYKIAAPTVHVSEGAAVNDIGSIASTTDELNNTTNYSYDTMGRLSGIAYPTPDIVAWNATTRSFTANPTTEYGIVGLHWKQVVQTGSGRTSTYYDARWNPVLTVTEDTALPGSQTFVVNRYDTSGRVVFSSYPVGSLSSVADASLKGTRSSYDALGRVIKTEQDSELSATVPLTATMAYLAGFQTQSTNARGKQTTTRYQVFDSPSTDAPVFIALPQGVTTAIARQPSLGKPLSVTRGGVYGGSSVSAVRSYVYDDNERLCKTINPESGATVVGYDLAGNVDWSAEGTLLTSTAQTSCTGDRVAALSGPYLDFSYDALNRRVTAAATAGDATTTTTYDDAGQATGVTATNPGGLATTSYTYGSKRGLLTGESSTAPGASTLSLAYAYNANAHVSQQTYPDGLVISYAPDALGRASKVAGPSGPDYASGITYHPGGAIQSFTYGNGIVHTMTQNLRRLPARSQDLYTDPVSHVTTATLDDTYAFDENGNVDYVTDIAGTGNQNRSKDLGYDDLDRLIVADAPNQWGQATYAYDPMDNLRSADQGSRQYRYNYSTITNRLTDIKTPAGATVFGFTYDARGNTSSKGTQAYTFDSANRLSQVNNLESYFYDGLGRRVRTTDQGGAINYWIYSQGGQVMYAKLGRSGKWQNYIYLGNTQVAVRSVDNATSVVSVAYQHTDSLGSPVVETTSARVPTRHSYAPYGEAYGEPTGGSVDGTGYTGHVMDRATGLTYMQQRYYDQQIGRVISVDPMAVDRKTAWNFNRFNYAAGNPYRFTDPDGRVIKIAGDREFKQKVADALNKLLAKPGGAALVQKLQSSSHIFKIVPSTNGNNGTGFLRTGAAEMTKATTPGVGTDGKVYYNPASTSLPNGGVDSSGSGQRPAFIGLAHELAHAQLIDEGRYNTDNGSRLEDTTPPSEQDVLPVENQIRKENGLSERRSYYD